MKKSIFLVALMAAATLFVSSCENEPVQVQAPQPPAVQEMAFTTVVRIPLVEGRKVTGEHEILNPSLMRAENVTRLAPAFAEVWRDAIAGKYPTYPIEDEFPSGVDESNYLAHVAREMKAAGFELDEAGMLGCLEVEYAGKARKGSSKMQAEWLRFVWTDPQQALPDRNICQVRIAALKGYQVDSGSGKTTLVDYLNARNYEGYPINVGTDRGMARMRSYEEARKVEVLTAQGELDQLTYYKAE